MIAMRRACSLLLAATLAAGLVPGRASAQPCFDVDVFAGRGVGDGGPATAAVLSSPRNVLRDPAGNLLVADAGNSRVRRIDVSGTITTIAGNGAPGVPDDGAVATIATLKEPSGIALLGNDVLIADVGESVNAVWRVTPDGILHRFAGSGIATGSIDGPGGDPADDLNDGQLAAFATLHAPVRVAVDGSGNVFIVDLGNNLVRKVNAATGRMSTLFTGLNAPIGIALGTGTDVFIADTGTNRILKGSTTGGALVPFAGTGAVGVANDRDTDPPLQALAAPLAGAAEIAVDATGVVYIGDTNNNVIHKVTTDGGIHRVAGSGIPGVQDAPTPGFLARFHSPGVALGAGQTLLIPDVDNNRIRTYDLVADVVTTIAGGDNLPGDGGSATAAILDRPAGLAVDPTTGAVFVTEHDSHRVRRIDTTGVISTIVNTNGLNDSATDGVPAVTSPLRQPTGVTLAGANLLIADAQDQRVLIVDGTGVIRTFAGTKQMPGATGDGGPATSALLNTPLRMAVAADGSVYIADFNNNRVRKVDPTGIMTTVAGGGGQLSLPSGLAFDGSGSLYIADFGSNRVLKLDPTGALSTIAGSGTAGKLGDNGQAGVAQLNGPTDVALAKDGGLLIVDQLNNSVRYVARGADGTISPTSIISTIVGDGMPAFKNGPGTQAELLQPTDVELDGAGNLLIADRGNQRVRIGRPGTDCTAATQMCTSDAQCDDNDPCTLDACEPNHFCSHTALPQGQCVPTCAAQPGGCIPGGGPRKVDCLDETLVQGVQGTSPVVRCHDNDTTCDFDPTPGRCGFRMASCFNEPGCPAAGVSRFTAQGPIGAAILQAVGKMPNASRAGNGVVFAQPLATPDTCTELMNVGVSLRKNGRKPGKLQLKTTAVGTSKRKRDVDKLRFICLP